MTSRVHAAPYDVPYIQSRVAQGLQNKSHEYIQTGGNTVQKACITPIGRPHKGLKTTCAHIYATLKHTPVAVAGGVSQLGWSLHWCLHWTHPLYRPLHPTGYWGCWLRSGWTASYEWSQRLIPPSSLAPEDRRACHRLNKTDLGSFSSYLIERIKLGN